MVQKQLQEELIQKIKENPELQKKVERMVNKITKKWERLNKKLNLINRNYGIYTIIYFREFNSFNFSCFFIKL